jgi:hypothetical protein
VIEKKKSKKKNITKKKLTSDSLKEKLPPETKERLVKRKK